MLCEGYFLINNDSQMPNFLRVSFFKTAKPKKFEPIPRFYDPHKEAIETLMQKQADSDKAKIERIKYKVKNNFQGSNNVSGRFAGSYKDRKSVV